MSAVPPKTRMPKIPEASLQSAVVDLARLHGWRVHHCHDARRCIGAGLPDLILARSGRLLFAELKSSQGRIRAEQAEWLFMLASVPGVECFVWRPSDWDTIVSLLA